jgi:peptidoglycan-associated lipoprotein
MNNFLKVLTLAGLAVVAACQGDQTRPDGESSGSSSAPRSSAPSTGSADSSIVGAPSATQGQAAGGTLPSSNIIYFEFDSSDLKPEGAQLAEAWAQYLAANPGSKVRLEGHADERGTREYNVALGERRANAVLQTLTARGVGERQLGVSSFGEERPVAMGHDDAAWQQNRRVEIVQ